jgi:N-acetylmuramoyl-L-alanine amidase
MSSAQADEVIRRPLEPGLYALGKGGGTFGLEVVASQGGATQRVLGKYLAVESEWTMYRGRSSTFVPLARLKAEYRRRVLLTVFELDAVNADGWYHHTAFAAETLWAVSALITGNGSNATQILGAAFNDSLPPTLPRGTTVLIPATYLDPVMRQITPNRVPAPSLFREPAPELASLDGALRMGKDAQGRYAAYTLKRGESLYTSVVARFTDYHDNADILQACEAVAARSRIKDVRDIDTGSEIRIPLDMLSARYQPKGTPDREEYEKVIREAARIKGNQGRAQGLAGVVVILDPGHGGQDPGARYTPDALFEDEINYDIVCRIKGLLERETHARVYVTMVDRSSQYTASGATRFGNDTDEELLTTPRHKNSDGATVSANLRWMLVNSIYQAETRRGVDPNKIVFTSVHTDMLYNEKLRGAMIYIPGAQYRRQEEVRRDAVYAVYQEGKSYNHFTSSVSERRRDEALSRNFADAILVELAREQIKRHDQGDPVRAVVRKDRNQVYVPAVIRNTKVPTKVLVETANLNNATDRGRLADPSWRQQFAEAYVDALKRYYGSEVTTRVAQVGR